MNKPLIGPAIFFGAGIVLGMAFLSFPWSSLTALGLAVLSLVLMGHRAGHVWKSVLAAVLPLALGAVLIVHSLVRLPADHYRASGFPDGSVHTITGTIVSPLDRDPGRTAFLMDISAIDGSAASGRLRATIRSELLPIGYADRLSVRGRFFPVRSYRNPGGFDQEAYLARQDVYGIASMRRPSDITVQEQGTGVLRMVQDLRERIRRSFLRSTTGDGSAVLQAMVLGEEGGLTDGLRDSFMAAGVTHILSISGSHLGLVAIICFWCFRNLPFLLPERWYHRITLHMDIRKAAAAAAALPVIFYAFLAGGQTATIRSLIMILAGFTAFVLDRERDIISALALAALLILVPSPQALADISFQLSFLSLLAILFVVDTAGRLGPVPASRPRRWIRSAVMLFAVSFAAAAATAPLTAYYFHQISLAGIAANMIVVPFAGAVVVPLGLLSGLLSIPLGHLPFAVLNQAAADTFISLVAFFARLPGSAFAVPSPGVVFFAGYAGLIISAGSWLRTVLLSRARPLEFPAVRSLGVPGAAAASIMLLAITTGASFVGGGSTRVTFLDVGQGDCAIVETAGGKAVLIDGGGTRDNRFDVGRRVVVPYLLDRGIRKLDLVVLSHPHPDHMNGLNSVLQDFPVHEVWWSGKDGELEGFPQVRQAAAAAGIPLRSVTVGYRSTLADLSLDVLHPPAGRWQHERRAYAAENGRSLVLRVAAGPAVFLFPGDLHSEGERYLCGSQRDLHADVLKVPHHGSRTSSSTDLVEAVRPAAAVISVGGSNPYGHPADEVVDRYREAGADVWRTDRDGAVIVTADGTGIRTVRWTDLELRRITVGGITSWGKEERENWRRVWIRTRGI